MHLAKKLSSKIVHTELDVIDKTIVPCANIYLEMQYYEKAMSELNDGIMICLKHEALDVYKQKRKELCEYLRDVAELTNKRDMYISLIKQLETDTEEIQYRFKILQSLDALCSAYSFEV